MKKRILVVDDEELMRSAIRATLRSSGYETDECADGMEALERIKSHIPDLIVCDVNMPKMNGFQLIQELRKSNASSTIPFVFLTGQADPADLRKGMMLGADDYITKPFQTDELIRAVELRLKKHQDVQNKMETKLEELRKSISLSLPHEFRTPLTGILGFSEILKTSEGLSQEEASYIGTHIYGSAKRLQRLLENILLMTELDILATGVEGLKRIRQSSAAVGIVVSQVVESMANEAGRKDDMRISVQDARVKVSGAHLSKAVEEIVSNALKFSSKGMLIQVSASIQEGFAVLAVEDKGKGMSEEQIQRIGAYVQFDRGHREQQGSGLGLSLVKKIAQLYGGSLSVESSPSSGTKVTLKFPLAE